MGGHHNHENVYASTNNTLATNAHVAIHAAFMTLLTFVVMPLLYALAARGNISVHKKIAYAAASLLVAALAHAYAAVGGHDDPASNHRALGNFSQTSGSRNVTDADADNNHHGALHTAGGASVTALLLVQLTAAALRRMPVFKKMHKVCGVLLVVWAMPFQWLTGVRTACADTSAKLAGHYSISAFVLLFVSQTFFWKTFNDCHRKWIEPAGLALGGLFGMLGDVVASSNMPESRVHHMYLYTTFIVCGSVQFCVPERLRKACPTVAYVTFAMLMSTHHLQTGGLAQIMHALCGLMLGGMAFTRWRDDTGAFSVFGLAFAALFSLSQPAVSACWVAYTNAPAVYVTLSLQVTAILCCVGWYISDPARARGTATHLARSKNDDDTASVGAFHKFENSYAGTCDNACYMPPSPQT